MKFKYIGTCASGFVVVCGVRFDEGKAVEVTDPATISKLKANSHFEGQKSKKVEKAKNGSIESRHSNPGAY